jgi:hypothetical protein
VIRAQWNVKNMAVIKPANGPSIQNVNRTYRFTKFV